jgi:adenylate kinase family enzyme
VKIEEFIQEQFNERYKHFIIYGPPNHGKTKLAKELAASSNMKYIDLLGIFTNDEKMKSEIDLFNPQKLFTLLQCESEKLVVIDQMDFLINTWDDTQFRELLVFIDQNQSKTCYVFIMHNYRILEKEKSVKQNDRGHERILNIYNMRQGGMING